MEEKNYVAEKITQQIIKLEEIIENLLKDIEMGDMSSYEKLTIVHKFFGQYQRAIEMRQNNIIDKPEERDSIIISLMSQMRQPSKKSINTREREEEDG